MGFLHNNVHNAHTKIEINGCVLSGKFTDELFLLS